MSTPEAPESMVSKDTGTVPVEKLWNVRQLEALARAYTLLALMVSPSAAGYEEYCLLAYMCLRRIWQVRRQAARCPVPSSWQGPTPPPAAHGPRRLVPSSDNSPAPTAVAGDTLL